MRKTIITKITVPLLALAMFLTACGKDDNNTKSKVGKEIIAEELVDYYIIEEYTPKPTYASDYGTKPVLVYTYTQYYAGAVNYKTRSGFPLFNYDPIQTELIYNPETGITRLKTDFGDYELSRDDNRQIIVKRSNQDVNSDLGSVLSKYIPSGYIQLVKAVNSQYNILTYKEISGPGFYTFNNGGRWKYKQGAAPGYSELDWNYTTATNLIWYGGDNGTAKYSNIFLILPKGNGWKGQHKDKELLIVNTMKYGNSSVSFEAVGDIGIYTIKD